jgi:hypothetical protein
MCDACVRCALVHMRLDALACVQSPSLGPLPSKPFSKYMKRARCVTFVFKPVRGRLVASPCSHYHSSPFSTHIHYIVSPAPPSPKHTQSF